MADLLIGDARVGSTALCATGRPCVTMTACSTTRSRRPSRRCRVSTSGGRWRADGRSTSGWASRLATITTWKSRCGVRTARTSGTAWRTPTSCCASIHRAQGGVRGNRADVVEPPAFQLQARAPRSTFDLFLENVGGGTWTFRRDLRIHQPLADVTTTVASGVRALRPEVQLLYMAKSDEPKHQLDFDAALPLLDSRARDWLATTLATTHPGHRWREQLVR
jgi:hypothetical protein